MKLHISEDISLPTDAVTQTFAILAKRGTGKTYTASVLAEEMLKAGQQIVALDPTGAWWGLRSAFPVVIFGGEHADVPLEESAGEVVAKAIVEHGFSAVIDLSLFRKGEMIRFMVAFAETLYRLNRSPLHLFVDEADAVAPQNKNYGGSENPMLGAMEDIVRRGRKRGIGCTLITQRPAVINKNVLTQCEVLIAMRLVHPRDIDAIEEWVNVHADPEQAKQMIASLPSLPIGTAWIWSPGWGDIFKRVAIRQRETFDSGATPKPGEKPQRPKSLKEIDLSVLGEQIKATVERAKENDPSEMRRTVAELRRKLASAESRPSEVKQARVEVPILDDASKRLLEKIQQCLESAVKSDNERAAHFSELNRGVMAIWEKLSVLVSAADHAALTRTKPVLFKEVKRIIYSKPAESNGNGELTGGARAILIAAAQHPQGVTDEQIAVLTGYRETSRRTYKQRLMSQGYLADGGIGYVATNEGVKALGSDFEPLPTGPELREYWLRRLSGGELIILKHLVEVYPASCKDAELEQVTNYKETSLRTYRQRLSARRLITVTREGITANRELFE